MKFVVLGEVVEGNLQLMCISMQQRTHSGVNRRDGMQSMKKAARAIDNQIKCFFRILALHNRSLRSHLYCYWKRLQISAR